MNGAEEGMGSGRGGGPRRAALERVSQSDTYPLSNDNTGGFREGYLGLASNLVSKPVRLARARAPSGGAFSQHLMTGGAMIILPQIRQK